MAAKTTAGVEVARRLRELRERLGIPRERVALAFGMSAENWRHYESGRNQLAATQLPILADLFGISLEKLVRELFEPDAATAARPPCDTGTHRGPPRHTSDNCGYRETDRFGTERPHARTRELVPV